MARTRFSKFSKSILTAFGLLGRGTGLSSTFASAGVADGVGVGVAAGVGCSEGCVVGCAFAPCGGGACAGVGGGGRGVSLLFTRSSSLPGRKSAGPRNV